MAFTMGHEFVNRTAWHRTTNTFGRVVTVDTTRSGAVTAVRVAIRGTATEATWPWGECELLPADG